MLDAVARIVGEGGVPAVSMTKVAERAGISRATLYKYFPEVEALLTGWHQRQVEQHLAYLGQVRARAGRSGGSGLQALRSVLEAYALMLLGTRMSDAPAFLHSSAPGSSAQEPLQDFLTELIREAAGQSSRGEAVRSDVASRELALYCLHAVNAAASLPSAEAARSLVGVIVDGMTPISAARL